MTNNVPFPDGIHDMPNSDLFRILALRAFELATNDEGRHHVLGSLLGAIEEDRLLAAQDRNQARLDKLQEWQFEHPDEMPEEGEEPEGVGEQPATSSNTPTFVLVQQAPDIDDDEDDDFPTEDA